jgi:hypothetical protein
MQILFELTRLGFTGSELIEVAGVFVKVIT